MERFGRLAWATSDVNGLGYWLGQLVMCALELIPWLATPRYTVCSPFVDVLQSAVIAVLCFSDDHRPSHMLLNGLRSSLR